MPSPWMLRSPLAFSDFEPNTTSFGCLGAGMDLPTFGIPRYGTAPAAVSPHREKRLRAHPKAVEHDLNTPYHHQPPRTIRE